MSQAVSRPRPISCSVYVWVYVAATPRGAPRPTVAHLSAAYVVSPGGSRCWSRAATRSGKRGSSSSTLRPSPAHRSRRGSR
eukprot:scaffold59081_cov34-Phaeocystis_antarctica.AAC.3